MIAKRDADASEDSFSLSQSNHAFGAVAYLNMLPFFCDDQRIMLFETPAELNEHLGSGQLLAGCSSVIAGLRSQLDVIPGWFGVAADFQVESVFFEPFVQSNSTRELWKTVIASNHLVINSFEERLQKLSRRSMDSASWHRKVKIFSSGASAQSLWLLQTLFLLQGLSPEVVLISAEQSQLSLPDLHNCLNVGEELACLLTIGDPALERRTLISHDPQNQCIDLAQFWYDFCGLPCIFAMWFLGRKVTKDLAGRASEVIAAKAEKWECLDAKEKLKLALDFLRRTHKSELATLIGNDFLISYMNNLKYRLNEAPYQKSFMLMRALYEAQNLSSADFGQPANLHNFSGKEVGVFKPFNS